MKTTIELPDTLMRQVKLRAVNEGKKLKNIVAELLQRGLSSPDTATFTGRESPITRDERSGLPVIRCRHSATSSQRLTPERISEILLEQEVTWQDEATR